MPRQKRTKSNSKVYHCMLRGINKQDIFFDKRDYLKFQDIIKEKKDFYSFKLYSYILMSNHIHLEIKDEKEQLSQIMHSIATAYAKYFNKKYKRVGHVFENRFLSKNVESLYYILNLVRYIHQNPVKACIERIDKYNWSSYCEYLRYMKMKNKKLGYFLCDVEEILELFVDYENGDKQNIRQVHNDFLEFNNNILKFDSSEELLEYEIKKTLTDEEVMYFIKRQLQIENIQEIQKYNPKKRNEIIRRVKSVKGVKQDQIARILGINIEVIKKACSR